MKNIFLALSVMVISVTICETSFAEECKAKLSHLNPKIYDQVYLDNNPTETPYRFDSIRKSQDDQPAEQLWVVNSADYSPTADQELIKAGYTGVRILNPTDKEILEHSDFLLVPEVTRTIMIAPNSEEDWVAQMQTTKARTNLKSKLKKSLAVDGEGKRAVTTELANLTLADYSKWYTELYLPEIIGGKEGGMAAWGDVSQYAAEKKIDITDGNLNKKVPDLHRVFFYSKDHKLIGGMLFREMHSQGFISVGAAAFESNARKLYNLPVRGFSEIFNEVHRLGFKYLSYGKDFYYGGDLSIGLMQNKASLGMRIIIPLPSDEGNFYLTKYFSNAPARLGASKYENKTFPGMVFYAIRGTGQERLKNYHLMQASQVATRTIPEAMLAVEQTMAVHQILAADNSPKIEVPQGLTHVKIQSVSALTPHKQYPALSTSGGLGFRNYISGHVVSTSVDMANNYTAQGFLDWALSVMPVKDLAQAKTILAKFVSFKEDYAHPIMRPMFLIDEKSEIENQATPEAKLAKYNELIMKNPLVDFEKGLDQDPFLVPMIERARFNPARVRPMAMNLTKSDETPFPLISFYSNQGYTHPIERGMLKSKVLQASGVYSKLQYEARRKYRAGVRYRFNFDFDQSLNNLSGQERKMQLSTQNRYKNPELLKKMKMLYDHGQAFTFEAIDESVTPHKVLGGILGLITGKLISIDTTIGNVGNIDSARITGMALSDIAAEQGLEFLDMGMVSNYSKSLRAGYYPQVEFLSFLNSPEFKSDSKFKLPAEWVPPGINPGK